MGDYKDLDDIREMRQRYDRIGPRFKALDELLYRTASEDVEHAALRGELQEIRSWVSECEENERRWIHIASESVGSAAAQAEQEEDAEEEWQPEGMNLDRNMPVLVYGCTMPEEEWEQRPLYFGYGAGWQYFLHQYNGVSCSHVFMYCCPIHVRKSVKDAMERIVDTYYDTWVDDYDAYNALIQRELGVSSEGGYSASEAYFPLSDAEVWQIERLLAPGAPRPWEDVPEKAREGRYFQFYLLGCNSD